MRMIKEGEYEEEVQRTPLACAKMKYSCGNGGVVWCGCDIVWWCFLMYGKC